MNTRKKEKGAPVDKMELYLSRRKWQCQRMQGAATAQRAKKPVELQFTTSKKMNVRLTQRTGELQQWRKDLLFLELHNCKYSLILLSFMTVVVRFRTA